MANPEDRIGFLGGGTIAFAIGSRLIASGILSLCVFFTDFFIQSFFCDGFFFQVS